MRHGRCGSSSASRRRPGRRSRERAASAAAPAPAGPARRTSGAVRLGVGDRPAHRRVRSRRRVRCWAPARGRGRARGTPRGRTAPPRGCAASAASIAGRELRHRERRVEVDLGGDEQLVGSDVLRQHVDDAPHVGRVGDLGLRCARSSPGVADSPISELFISVATMIATRISTTPMPSVPMASQTGSPVSDGQAHARAPRSTRPTARRDPRPAAPAARGCATRGCTRPAPRPAVRPRVADGGAQREGLEHDRDAEDGEGDRRATRGPRARGSCGTPRRARRGRRP